MLVHATGIFFSRDGASLGNVWKKVQRIYEKFGIANEWQLADQANVVGHSLNECPLTPGSEFTLRAPVPVFWHPSVGPALLGDTLLCRDSANVHLTDSESWPQIPVRVKGREVRCPGILVLKNSAGSQTTTVSSAAESAVNFDCPDHPEEEMPSPLESVWEMKIPENADAWEEDASAWSEESVVE